VDTTISKRMAEKVSTLTQDQKAKYENLKGLLENLDELIQRISDQVRNVEDHLESKERVAILT